MLLDKIKMLLFNKKIDPSPVAIGTHAYTRYPASAYYALLKCERKVIRYYGLCGFDVDRMDVLWVIVDGRGELYNAKTGVLMFSSYHVTWSLPNWKISAPILYKTERDK